MSRKWEAVIGLEIHAQLRTASKMFCGCATTFGAPANTQTCPVCAGLPGVLPVLNRRAVEMALMAAAATRCSVPERSVFARKNYFYPDLPKGYQVSQYEAPLAVGGRLEFESEGGIVGVGLTRIHLEEDAGKLIHGVNLGDAESSFVDLNRAGTPLMEIVTEPDLRTPAQARDFMIAMRRVLLFIGINDGNMEEGSLRCDANVSIRTAGEKKLGTKTEVKNMNSFKHVQKALEYEIERQIECVESGEAVIQETRLFDPDRGCTVSMRSKEAAHDYRYFPEPDLVPVAIDAAWYDAVKAALPELPDKKKERFATQYALPSYDADILTQMPELADFFEAAAALHPSAKKVSNWIMTELLRLLRESGREMRDLAVTPAGLAELLGLMDKDEISGPSAKEIFAEMFRSGRGAREIMAERGLAQISDSKAIEALVDEILHDYPDEVAAFRGGKEKVLGFLVGQVMKRSGGKSSPALVNRILKEKLRRD